MILGEAVATPGLFLPLGWDSSLRRGLAPAIAKATTGGALCHSRGAPPTRWIWGRSRPWPEPKGFRSTFAPPDARPRGTGRNGRGRRVTAEAVDRLFVHVAAIIRDQAGMAGDPPGDAAATCKIAGIAYTGSNPVPATLPLSCGNAAAGRPIRPGSTLRFRSGFPPPDAPPTPSASPARPAPPGRTRPRSAPPPEGRSVEAGPDWDAIDTHAKHLRRQD